VSDTTGISDFASLSGLIVEEIRRALAQVDAAQVRALEEAVLRAQALFLTGAGRSGLVARCFAMRLMHLGLPVHVVGETVTPALQPGDLLIAISGSGESATTCAVAESAAKHGAGVAAITSVEESRLARAAELALLVPGAGEEQPATSAQFGGTLFEQSAVVALDAIALSLQRHLRRTDEQMRARHATLE